MSLTHIWIVDKTSINDFGMMAGLQLRHVNISKKYDTHRNMGVCLHALYFYLLSKACVTQI